MTRAEKIKKLANAVREYHGAKLGDKFQIAPRPDRISRVVAWLERLGINNDRETLETIKGFKTYDEFNAWLRTL